MVRATASLFPVLAVPPSLGRVFSPEEDRPGADPVAVLSHGLWSRRFGSDPAILGKTIHLSGVATAIVGVMPARFQFPAPSAQLWIPLQVDRSQYNDASFSYFSVGRLRPGVTLERARSEMVPVLARLSQNFPGDLTPAMMEQAGFAPVLHSLKSDVVGEVETPLWILLGTVAFVLLVATANVANLFLVRAEGRHREIAVRRAIGARGRDIAKLYLSESLLLGLVGGAFGLALAHVVLRLFVGWGAVDLPRLEEVRIDAGVLLFTGAVSILAGFFFGAVPVLRHQSAPPAMGLNEIGRGLTAGRERLSARGLLVVSQVALALVLLIGSGLMARSFLRLRTVDPGFTTSNTLTFALSLPENEYPSEADVARFVRALGERIGGLPGVVAFGTTSRLPLSGSYDNNAIWIEDFPVPEGQIPPVHPTRFVSPDYFRALEIPLLSGRTFEWTDREKGFRAAIVSSSFAEKYWDGQSPLGKRVRPFDDPEPFTVVGMVGSARDEGIEKEPSATIYFPVGGHGYVDRTLQAAVRTRTPPDATFEGVREEIRGLDPNLPISGVGSMDELAARSIARTRFTMILLALAAGVAVLLGSIGIY
ncbi:MAG: ABC transporter permease, partial [Vicinamibacteria bacterium]